MGSRMHNVSDIADLLGADDDQERYFSSESSDLDTDDEPEERNRALQDAEDEDESVVFENLLQQSSESHSTPTTQEVNLSTNNNNSQTHSNHSEESLNLSPQHSVLNISTATTVYTPQTHSHSPTHPGSQAASDSESVRSTHSPIQMQLDQPTQSDHDSSNSDTDRPTAALATPPPPQRTTRGRLSRRGMRRRGARGAGVAPRRTTVQRWTTVQRRTAVQRDTGVGPDARWASVQAGFVPSEAVTPLITVHNNITESADEGSLLAPIDFFNLYMDDDLVNLTVQQTNMYADQCKMATPNPKKYSFLSTWQPVTSSEIRQWIGLTFLTGLIKKNEVRDYWSTNPLHSTPIFPTVMTRNRYQAIKKFIHWNDNSAAPAADDPDRDRLYKIRPLVSHLSEKFQEFFTPSANISIDECLLLYKGRLVWRQYIPLKRSRFGIKIYALCDSVTGYTYRFRIYTGAQDPATDITNDLPADCGSMLSSEQIVIWLMQPLLDKSYALYTDNYYTSVPLAKYLLSRGTHLTGTVRANRLPKTMRETA